jgi:hypothetical protein
MPTIYESIAKAPIVQGLDSEQLAFIAVGAEELTVAAGTLVLTQGEAAERFFLICDGSVALEIESPGSGAVRFLTFHEAMADDAARGGTGRRARSRRSDQPTNARSASLPRPMTGSPWASSSRSKSSWSSLR